MRMPHRAQALTIALCFAVAAFTAACQKSGTQTSSTSGTEGTAPSAQGVQVSSVDLGTGVANDNTVTEKTESFRPNQTIYASDRKSVV